MKLNNKGFAISSIMYIILVFAVLLIFLTLALLSSRKLILDKLKKEATNEVYEVYPLTYRQALSTLKQEAITYASDNEIEKDSIKISDLNSSIDSTTLSGYKLDSKYLTMVSNSDTYDIYLGEAKTTDSLNTGSMIDIVDYKISGNSKQAILPSEYQQVEYIESSGTQFIDTGVIPDNNTGIDLVYQAMHINVSQYILGVRDTAINYAINGSVSRTDWDIRFDGSVIYSNVERTTDKWRTKVSMDNGTGVWNLTNLNTNESYSFDFSDQTVTATLPLTLFSYNSNVENSYYYHSKLRIYQCKIYDGETLIRNFIPSYRKSDGIIGMYDLVNGVFYENDGTNTFEQGYDVPSQEVPLEVISVGDRTKNLLKLNDYVGSSSTMDYVIKDQVLTRTVTTAVSTSWLIQDPVLSETINAILEPGTYVWNLHNVSGNKIQGAYIQLETSTGTIDWYENNSITLTEMATVIAVRSDLLTYNVSDTQSFQIQLEKGSIATDYEPYGYKIPVEVSGNNLVNLANRNISFTDKYYVNTNPKTPSVLLEPNTKYTISFDYDIISITKTISCRVGYGNDYYEVDMSGQTYPTQSGTGHFIYTFTTPETFVSGKTPYLAIRFVSFNSKGDANVNISNIQIEKGNTATEYEPYVEPVTTNIYLDEPLRKVGTYDDELHYEGKKIARKVANKVFDGSEEWTLHTTTKEGGYGVFRNENLLTPLIGAPITSTFMSHFALTDISATATWGVGWYRFAYSSATGKVASSRVYISAQQTTVEEFQEWLATNKPRIFYPLAEPMDVVSTLPKINSNIGSSIIKIGTDMQSSNVEFTIIEKIKQL